MRTLSQPHVRGAATKRRNAIAALAEHRRDLAADIARRRAAADAEAYLHSRAATAPEYAGGDVTLYATGMQG